MKGMRGVEGWGVGDGPLSLDPPDLSLHIMYIILKNYIYIHMHVGWHYHYNNCFGSPVEGSAAAPSPLMPPM